MAQNRPTFQSEEPATADYAANKPAEPEAAFVYFAGHVLTAYGFAGALFLPATYRAEGYLAKDMATRLRFFKGKDAATIDTIIAVGVRRNYFDQPATATFEAFTNFLDFLRTAEGAAAVTEDLRRGKFQAAGKGVFRAIDIAAAAQLTVQSADFEQHKLRLIQASQAAVDELELMIAKEKEGLQERLRKSEAEFFPATIFKKLNPMKRQKECLILAKAADPALAATEVPSEEQLVEAIKQFGEQVDRKHAVDFLNQQNYLDHLRAYVNRKILSFRSRGKFRVATRLGHTLAAMDGQVTAEIPSSGAYADFGDDSSGESYHPNDDNQEYDESSADSAESGPDGAGSERFLSPVLTRAERARRGRTLPSSARRSATKRHKGPSRP